jgi:uncharacterized protein YcaQ
VTVHLSRADARRISVRAQLLDRRLDPTFGIVELVRRLTLVQCDFTAAVAPNADHIAWSRFGSGYQRDELATALQRRELIVLRGMIRPAEDIALFREEMSGWGTADSPDWQRGVLAWTAKNSACHADILARLAGEGPLLAREIPDSCVVPWRSSGWSNDQNVIKMLECMEARGEVAVAGHEGRTRLWDLASRVYPDVEAIPAAQAQQIRRERRLRAMGVARARGPETLWGPSGVGEVGEPAVIEGVRGTWRVDPSWIDGPPPQRTALLSPLDRLVFDRKQLLEIFAFDYQLEMYKPAATRRWGYWALPILHEDQFVGKLDATADPSEGVLRARAVHSDVSLTPAMREAIDAEIDDLARWLGLELAF